jgi:hypothetical protein
MTPVNVYKHHLDGFFLIFPFSKHNEIKDSILTDIGTQKSECLQVTEEYCTDSITKLDWSIADNFEREWVLNFKPHLDKLLNDVVNACGYVECQINELWFQQYFTNDKHGWHTHGSNFTGVYYLELPDTAPQTQLINPFTQTDIIIPDVKEGDILIFPSYVIHRAPKITDNFRKTIISFNCNFDKVQPDVLNHITTIADAIPTKDVHI